MRNSIRTAAALLMLAGCATHPEEGPPKDSRLEALAADPRYSDFFKALKNAVGAHWHPTTLLRQKDPTGNLFGGVSRYTLVSVTLGPDGTLRDIQVTKSCGVDFLDEEAVQAFKRSQPFPPPPAGLLTDNAFQFEFGFAMQFPGQSWHVSEHEPRSDAGLEGNLRPDGG